MPYLLQRAAALGALVALGPMLALVAVAILVAEGRPIFYVGQRVGRHRVLFGQLKFRTMVRDADRLLVGGLESDAPAGRVTKIGRFLRMTSIDELPQLVNVVRGEMALVGPRPMLPEIAERVDPGHPRFAVLPGLTGLAQVSGRNDLAWSRRLELDAEYATGRRTWGDVVLLVRTVRAVALREGISPDRNAGQVLDI